MSGRWFHWPKPEDNIRYQELAEEEDGGAQVDEESGLVESTVIDIGSQPTYLLVAYRLAQYDAAGRLTSLLSGHPHERALRRIWRDYAHFTAWLLSWEITERVEQRLREIDLPPVA